MRGEKYQMRFQNLSKSEMNFEDVFKEIIAFMKKEPMGNYKLMIGTDSQVFGTHTRFVTGIAIQREGKGAWACIRKINVPRKIRNLHEKISIETSLTEEIAYMFDEEKKNRMIEIVLPHIYKGASFAMEGHLDIGIGKRNKTREFVNEMVSRIESMGIEAKIKPDSIIASGYANRYTK